jgi:hypothetical protein
MKVLIACEYSGRVRDEFIKLGHDAISCDLLPSDAPGPHYQGSVFDIIGGGYDLMIAHPPCTYLTNSGVTWLHKDIKRWPMLFEGAEFFKKLLNANIPRIAIENPIMHKYARSIIGVDKSQIVQPWQFGHAESKATCFWLKGLEPLKETNNVKEEFLKRDKKDAQRLHYLPPSADRWKIRSTTFPGIAKAIAEQWGKHENH